MEASGLPLPASEQDRIVEPLERLEQTFRPLVQDLAPALEPSFACEAGEDE